MEKVISCVFFCFRKPVNSEQAWPECHIINYLLTKPARAVLGNIDPQSIVLYKPALHSVRTATTSGQYSPVRSSLSRSVSKRKTNYHPTAANTVQITVQVYSDLYSRSGSCLPSLCRKPVCRTGRRERAKLNLVPRAFRPSPSPREKPWERGCAKLSHSPSFIDNFIDHRSWVINLLLDVLVCSIAVYFNSLFVF